MADNDVNPGDTPQGDAKVAEPEATTVDTAPEPKPEPKPAGGETPAVNGKTYTEAELQGILHKRTQEYGRVLESYKKFGTPEELAAKLNGQQTQAPQPENPEEAKFRNWLVQKFPQLGRLDSIDKLEQVVQTWQNDKQSEWNEFVETGQSKVSELVKKDLGIEDAVRTKWIEDMVASVIASDTKTDENGNEVPGALQRRWMRGDLSVVEDAYNRVKKEIFGEMEKRLAANYSKNKVAAGNLPKPPQEGSVPAPTSRREKVSDDERVAASFDFLQKHKA